ncbi:hypothetical protein JKF63_01804 [Porcisia hertigi]|uniref:Uncharacterized protein n=1 Tax=Porcisia hertigi TaxID=2761500 RepID=A0A836L1P4_9TRYP|nr:hypothetical protein JKF63_01804 [Porcisia hertigi]
MSLLQKIFTPGSFTKKKKLLHSEPDGEERHSPSSFKVSSSRNKRKLAAELSDSDTSEFLMQSVSTAVNCDPVPTSFKTSASFATQPKLPLGSVSPKSVRLTGSFSNTSGLFERPQHTTNTLATSFTRHNQRSLFDKVHSAGSFAAGDTAVHSSSFSANGSTVNLWRLPWTQQRVTMCPNCHRPRQRDRNTYVSRATYVVPHVVGGAGMGDDMSEAGDMSDGDSEVLNGPANDSLTHCRCGAAAEDDAQLHSSGVAVAAGQLPPVFVVETQMSSAEKLPGSIDKDSESDNEEGVRVRQSYRLSQVSPLTSASLQHRQLTLQPGMKTTSNRASTASVPSSVSHWLHEQQVSEVPAASKKKKAS